MEDKNLYELLTEDFVEPAANFYMTSENRKKFYELWGQFKKTLAGYTRQKGRRIADRERIAEMALSYEEYMKIHAEWAKEPSSIENLLRRVSHETVYKVLKHTRQPEPPQDKIEAVAIHLVARAEETNLVDATQLWNRYAEAANQYGHLGDCTKEPQTCALCLVEGLKGSAYEILKLSPEYEPVELEVLGDEEILSLVTDYHFSGEQNRHILANKVSQATIQKNQKGQLFRLKEEECS